MNFEKRTNSPEETIAFGKECALSFGPGRVFALEADLGGGKTVFAKGLATGFGVSDTDIVTSPTFTLINRYLGDTGIIFHIDLYRLHSSAEAVDIGIEEILLSGDTVIIEWPKRIKDLLSGYAPVEAVITAEGENERLIRISE